MEAIYLLRWRSILMALIDIIFPPACLACHRGLGRGQKILCIECESQIRKISENYCQLCGSELVDGSCETCKDTEFCFDFARSSMRYAAPLTHLIHKLKYQGYRVVARYLAQKMAESMQEYPEYQDYPYLVAVPLHRVRLRERGYNQSDLIARHLARLTNKKWIRPLQRVHYTLSQTNLHRTQRLSNLNGAFRVYKAAEIRGQNLILIDDVFTTGSTINEISKTLKAAGAAKVAALTATRA